MDDKNNIFRKQKKISLRTFLRERLLKILVISFFPPQEFQIKRWLIKGMKQHKKDSS